MLNHGAVVFTQNQTAGRGQQGRTWHAPPGVLTASFVIDRLPAAQLPGLSLAAGLAVIYAVEDLAPDCRDRLRLKWPNDVLVDRRKLAGILCEATSGSSSRQARAIVGIGLNRQVNFASTELPGTELPGTELPSGDPVSLHELSTGVPQEVALLERLRHYLLETADLLTRAEGNSGLALLLPEIRRRDAFLGCEVTIELPTQVLKGEAIGITPHGQLHVRLLDGQVRTFTSGRVRWA
jgi:BirA family transcriptional regulator, biotin operon repressor / biotin---[acetyl-CoA-carboxylase] ligase